MLPKVARLGAKGSYALFPLKMCPASSAGARLPYLHVGSAASLYEPDTEGSSQ